MDICNENLTSSSITRVDSLIFGYLNRQQYTKTVTALLEESPVLKNVGGRFGGGREIFIQINPTVCDKDLEYIVETFAQYGRFDVPPEFVEFGQQLRCLANDFSRMTSVLGLSRSENQQKMYGSRSRTKAPTSLLPSKESSTCSQVSSATPTVVYHIPQHPLTVDSPTPQNIPFLGKHQSSNRVLNDINNQKLSEHVSYNKPLSQNEKRMLHPNPCDVQPFHSNDNINLSNSNNLDPPIHSDDQDPSNMHSMLSDEGSSRRKRQHPHSYSERFVSKLADAASRTKQCRELVTSTTSAADLSTLDIGNEIYDLFDIRNLPSQLEEVVCRFDPEDRFYDYAGFMDMEGSLEHPFEQNIAPGVQILEPPPDFSLPLESTVVRTPNIVLPKEPQPELLNNSLSLMPQTSKNDLNIARPYVMKGPRSVPTKKQTKVLTERTFIKDIKLVEAKNVPLRTKITMDSLFDDGESSSSESLETVDKNKRNKSPDYKKKKDLKEDTQKARDHSVKERKSEKVIKERREERDLERRKHEKEEKRNEEHRKNIDTEKPRISRVEKNEDRKKHERFREESEKREQERKKKELGVRSARELENQRREEAMKRREEDRRRAHEEKKRPVEQHRDDEKPVTEDSEPSRDEDRRIRDKRRTFEEDTSSHETERSERESWENRNRDDQNKKKRAKDTGSSSALDIFGEIEKNFDSLRRHDRSPSPDVAFLNIKKLAPSTKIPKKGSDHSLAQAEKYSEPETSHYLHVHGSGKESDSSTSSSSQGTVREAPPRIEHTTTTSTSKVAAKSQLVSGLPCEELNLLIRSTVNDARIGLQFESAAVKWRRTPAVGPSTSTVTPATPFQESGSSKASAEKEQDSRKRSSQNTLNLGKLFSENGSPKDANKKKIKLDLSAIESIMKKVHGNTPSTS